MARVTETPSIDFKGHQGAPTSPVDYNSIEAAVKGQMSSPPSSINDFDTLVALSNWQLLDEQATIQNGTPILRGQQPTSYGHFQGFPKVTVSMSINYFEYDSTSGALDLYVQLNNRVGYPIQMTIRARMTNTINSNTQKDVTLTFQPGETAKIFTFEWNTSTFGASEEYLIEYLNSSESVYPPSNLSGIKTRLSSGPGPGETSYSVLVSMFGFSCYTPSGSATTHIFEGPLQIGTRVRRLDGTRPITDTYIESSGAFIYTTDIDGYITQFEFCEQT